MVRVHRLCTVAAMVAGLMGAPLSPVLRASEGPPEFAPPSPSIHRSAVPPSPFTLNDAALGLEPAPSLGASGWRASAAVAESRQWGRRRGYGRRHNDGAHAAVLLGAIGAIAGTAVLVYANRPECGDNPAAGGCGYGTKVVGGAALAAGAVGLAVGAATWR